MLLKLVMGLFIFTGSLFAGNKTPNQISLSSQKSIFINGWKTTAYQQGKDFSHLPDSVWIPREKLPGKKDKAVGEWLLKAEILIIDSASKGTVYGIFPGRYITAYEIFWDGIKIGQNGKPGSNAVKTVPGRFEYDLIIPNNLLSPGRHIIIYHLSNFSDDSYWKWYNGWTMIGPYSQQLKTFYDSRYRGFILSGILFIPFLFNLFLFITRKFKIEHLLFAVLCLAVIFDHLVAQMPVFFNLNTTYTHTEFRIYIYLVLFNSLLIPVFFMYLFLIPKKILLPAIAIINLGIFPLVEIWNIYTIYPAAILIESMLLTTWALYKRKEGSLIILVGIIFSWIGYFYNFAFAALNTILVICTSLSIAIQFAKKEKGEQEALLRSSRLENELLKKNINAHFLMNTLTSVIVWLRRDPECAIKLIEALANEFRMVISISAQKAIPLRQEIELCNTHLKIMNIRKGAEYKLFTEGINEEDLVPPMIFHTLIENGLTHGYENKNCGTFKLFCSTNNNSTRYILSNDGDFIDCDKKNSNGFGLQYIRTRLEESFPGKWNLESCREENDWKVIIDINK